MAGLCRDRHLLPGTAAKHQRRSSRREQECGCPGPSPERRQHASNSARFVAGTGLAPQRADRPSRSAHHGSCRFSGVACQPVVGAAQAAAKRSACRGSATSRHACWTGGSARGLRRAMVARVLGASERIPRQRTADSGYSRRRLEPLGRTAGGGFLGCLELPQPCDPETWRTAVPGCGRLHSDGSLRTAKLGRASYILTPLFDAGQRCRSAHGSAQLRRSTAGHQSLGQLVPALQARDAGIGPSAKRPSRRALHLDQPG